jgi:hypothetical protein
VGVACPVWNFYCVDWCAHPINSCLNPKPVPREGRRDSVSRVTSKNRFCIEELAVGSSRLRWLVTTRANIVDRRDLLGRARQPGQA